MKYFCLTCFALETVDLSKFKAKIISAEEMFSGCNKQKKADLSGVTFTDESKIESMFNGTTILLDKDKIITKSQKVLDEFDKREKGEIFEEEAGEE